MNYKSFNLFIVIVGLSFSWLMGWSQKTIEPFIKLTEPLKENNIVYSNQKFIIGSTCKSCVVSINQIPVKVYSTGGFAMELNLVEGDTSFTIISSSKNSKEISKTIQYTYKKPLAEKEVSNLSIERIQIFPEGDLIVKPGDILSFKVKALPNCKVKLMNGFVLYEMPKTNSNAIQGIYQGEYIVQSTDTFNQTKLIVQLDSAGKIISKSSSSSYTVMRDTSIDMVVTKGRLAHLLYGLGEDRLGGAKIGYIDSLIPLKVIGKVGSNYKIQLTKNRTAYIPDELVNPLPKGSFTAKSLTDKIRVMGDSNYDYVKVQLFSKLAYQSFQLTEPSKIIVDVFGATSNTNWIDQLSSAKEIKKVEYEQIADEILRLTITLNHHQHWGHKIFYKDNVLIIQVKHQPKNLSLNNLTIAVDAGHGGTNTGAVGPTGIAEKMITLPIAIKLQKLLENEGAKVIMTRTTETFFDNKERILFYRDSTPDLLISIHLNASTDPFRSSGTSTFYRYEGFKPLSNAIYKRMLELGLKEYGNNGSFNFMLNSPTEYPNALVETLFLSNLEEEEKVLDESFQQKIAEKILLGMKDFLQSCM